MPKKNKRKNLKKRLKQQAYSKMRQRLEGSGREIIQVPKGQVKMSDVIIDFAKPLLESCEDEDDRTFKKAIAIAVVCWNLAILSEDERDKIKNNLINDFFPSDIDLAKKTINALLERKQTSFADIKRLIVDYEIVALKNERRVNVASITQEDEKQNQSPPSQRH